MDFDAFTGGVEPGGLRNKNDICILICYLINSANRPLKKEDIVSVIVNNGLANYFETNDAMYDLLQSGNIAEFENKKDYYILTGRGKMIANQLDTTLPFTTRDKALSACISLLAKQKLQKENPVKVEKLENGGYNVSFSITDGSMTLMSFTVFMPDYSQVNLIKRSFYNDPQYIYTVLLAALTENREMIKDSLDKLIAK